MVYKTFPTDAVTDADVTTCANQFAVNPLAAAKFIQGLSESDLNGMKAHITHPKSWGLTAADWKEAFPSLSGFTDAQVNTLLCWLAAKTTAVALDV